MNIRKVAFAAILVALPVAAQAQTIIIDFNSPNTSGPYGGNGSPFTSSTQNGYTATVTSGSYIQYLNPGPFAFSPAIATGYYNATTNAVLSLTGPGLFSLASFDAFSDDTASTFTVSGYLGSTLVYSSGGIVAVPANTANYTTYSGFNSAAVDRVTLATTAPFRLTLDNIALTTAAAAVPEPASWAMMVAGFGLIGGAVRRRRVQVSFA